MHEDTNSPPTIFLVEEDNATRQPLTRLLRQHGYRLLVCAEMEDALSGRAGAPTFTRISYWSIYKANRRKKL
jgi:response regulator RpfG family c-di-GMP phosphodiesterase